jgi:hypothetical protein
MVIEKAKLATQKKGEESLSGKEKKKAKHELTSPAWGSLGLRRRFHYRTCVLMLSFHLGVIFEHKTNKNLMKSQIMLAKFRLLLRGSAALPDNPFRGFVTLILVYGQNMSLMVCDRSGVREFPTIDIADNDGLVSLVKLVVWLLFATPEQLGFFRGIGLLKKPTDCTVRIPKTDGSVDQLFKILGDPIVHITSDVINHQATVVFRAKEIRVEAENKPEILGPQELVLKVTYLSHCSCGLC